MKSLIGALVDGAILIALIAVVFWLNQKMRFGNVENPPLFRLSAVVIVYGLSLWFLTSLFLPSTGIAFYMPIFLLTVAPLIMLCVAILSFRERKKSAFHGAACLASIGYFYVLVGLLVLLARSCPPTTGGPP